MNEKKETITVQDIPIIIPSPLTKIYATGAFGGYTPFDFRVMLFSEEPLEQDVPLSPDQLNVMREVQAELVLSPLAAKQLGEWLLKQVKHFESEFGKIPSPPEQKKE